jgi:predicted nucleic acid-binding protein
MIQAFIRGEIRIAAHTSVELSLGRPDPESKLVLEALLSSDALMEIPVHDDFREAGRRLANRPRPDGTTAQRKDARIRRTMDAILAAVAWRRGWAVVTNNRKDFLGLQEKEAETILSPQVALS